MRKFTTPIHTVQQLAINVHDARKAAGLSQEQLAHETGLSRSWINRLETGKITNPGFNDILSVYEALNISDTVAYQVPDQQHTDASETDEQSSSESRGNHPSQQDLMSKIQQSQIDPIVDYNTNIRNAIAHSTTELPAAIVKNFTLSPEIKASINSITKILKQQATETKEKARQLDAPDSNQSSQ